MIWREVASIWRDPKPVDPCPQKLIFVGLHPEMARSLSKILTSQGHTVEGFADLILDQSHIHSTKPNVIVIDMSRAGREKSLEDYDKYKVYHYSIGDLNEAFFSLPDFIFLIGPNEPIQDESIPGVVDQILLTHTVEEIATIVRDIIWKTAPWGKPL